MLTLHQDVSITIAHSYVQNAGYKGTIYVTILLRDLYNWVISAAHPL